MKMLVCLKPIPETEGSTDLTAANPSFAPPAGSPFRMDAPDEAALELALQLRDARPAGRIEAVSVGPPGSEAVLKRALGLGVDHGIHILAESDLFLNPAVTAAWIAAAVRNGNYDLFLAGVLSEDGMHGQVGPLVAEHLSIPCAAGVQPTRVEVSGEGVRVERLIGEGLRDSLQLALPAMLTVQAGPPKLRYPSLSNILRAREQQLAVICADRLAAPGPGMAIFGFRHPQKSRAGLILKGGSAEKAQQFLKLLREKGLLG